MWWAWGGPPGHGLRVVPGEVARVAGSSVGPGEGSSPTAVADPLVGLCAGWCATEG